MSRVEVRVEGLADLRRALQRADHLDDLRELREGMRRAANLVVSDTKRRVPVRTGAARDSVRSAMGGNRAFVVGGKARVPYYGWLDFGSRNPRRGNPRVIGPWSGTGHGPEGGRFIYASIAANDRQIAALVGDAVNDALTALGI